MWHYRFIYREIFADIKAPFKAKAEDRFFRRLFSDIRILIFDLVTAKRSSEIIDPDHMR